MAQELLIAVYGDMNDNKTCTVELPRGDGKPADRFTVDSMAVLMPLIQLFKTARLSSQKPSRSIEHEEAA